MGNYYEGTLYLRFNKENGDKLFADLKILQEKHFDEKDLSVFSEIMRNAKWLTHPRAFYPNFTIYRAYPLNDGEIIYYSVPEDEDILEEYREVMQEIKSSPYIGYEVSVSFCMKHYKEEFDLGEAMVDFFRPYLDRSMYGTDGYIGNIQDEDSTYDQDFFVAESKPSSNAMSVSEEVKNQAIKKLKCIQEELDFVITQLQLEGKAFYHSFELASMIGSIDGLEWGTGTNRSGEKMFSAYFSNY